MTDIRALAKAATPGPWTNADSGKSSYATVRDKHGRLVADTCNLSRLEADAAYIAFMSPERALAMQDCVDALQKCVEAIKALEGAPVEYGPGMKLGHAAVAATAALARLEAIR